MVLKVAVNAGTLLSGNYFRNELFQIGGYKLMRGYDEESIYARHYGIATAEFRLLTGTNSYLFAFTDGGLSRYQDELRQLSRKHIGFGLGMNLQSGNSQVNLSWAVGNANQQGLDFRQSKIHLGILNFF